MRTPVGILFSLAIFILPVFAFAEHAPDELIIRMKPGKTAVFKTLNSATGAKTKRSIEKLGYYSVKLPKGADLDKELERYRANPNVEYVGLNHIIRIASVFPDDPVFYYGDEFWGVPQWGLYNDVGAYRADIHAPEAWEITTGSPNIVIAVLDTGIDLTHPDLVNKIWTNTGETPNNGIDDDHNGYIDDVNGWDFVSTDNDPTDDHEIYHGSLVSGIAAAESNNGIGIAGVSWQSPILPLKVIGADGSGSEDDAAAAAVYAVDMGAKILNMSFAGENAPALEAAVEYAWAHGVICVCASGNENSPLPTYPASYTHALAVGATNEYDERCTALDWGSGGSNYGSYLDVMAPGSYIVSTGSFLVDWGLAWEAYDTQSGTSAAAPFVSGLVALVWSVHPTWTTSEVVYHITHTSDDVGATGFDIYTGWGRVNAWRAVAETINQAQNVALVKQLLTNAEVSLSNKVLSTSSTDLANRLYIQDTDRSSGILLWFDGTVPSGLSPGDRVDILGVVGSVSGERAIMNPIVTRTTSSFVPRPLAMNNLAVGGGAFGLQGAVVNKYALPQKMAAGLNNIGLLISTFGKVTAVASNYFYIDDGSKLRDDTGNTGIRVSFNPDIIQRPDTGQYVSITGISSCEFVPGSTTKRRRVLLPRVQDDIVVVD